MKKNILIWSASYQPVLGGLQTITGTLAQGLKNRGKNIIILTNRIPSKLPKLELINDIPVYRYRFFHPIGTISSFKSFVISLYGFFIFPFRSIQLFFFIRTFKPDIINIHFPSQQIWWVKFLQKLFTNVEWIISLHGNEILQFFEVNDAVIQPHLKRKLPLAEKIKLHFLKSCLHNSKAVTACSSYLMSMTKILMNNKTFNGYVVYNCVDFARFETKSRKKLEEKYLFGYGRLIYEKGFDMLIRCFRRLLEQKGENYKLVIGGAGKELNNLKKLAVDLAVDDKIIFPGRLSSQDIVSYLQHSTLTIIPSRKEAFGISLLEAIAAKANVVATNIGGMPEIAKYGEVLLCPPNEDALFKAIQERLDKPDFTAAKDVPGLNTVFTQKNMIDQFIKIMHDSNETTLIDDSIETHLFQKSIAG